MNRMFLLAALLTAAGCATPATQATTPTSTADASFACPMHPDVTSDAPGDCSKCGMKLVKADSHDHGSHDHDAPAGDKPKTEDGHGHGH